LYKDTVETILFKLDQTTERHWCGFAAKALSAETPTGSATDLDTPLWFFF
jgi:hypothetical protein